MHPRGALRGFLARADIAMSEEEFEHEVYHRCLDRRREEKLRGKFVYEDFVDFIKEYGTDEPTRNLISSAQSFRKREQDGCIVQGGSVLADMKKGA